MEFHFAQNSTRDKQILYYLTLVCRWKIKRLNEHFIIIHFKTVPLMDDLILCLPAPPFRLPSITSVIHQVSCSRNCGTLDFPENNTKSIFYYSKTHKKHTYTLILTKKNYFTQSKTNKTRISVKNPCPHPYP